MPWQKILGKKVQQQESRNRSFSLKAWPGYKMSLFLTFGIHDVKDFGFYSSSI